MIPGKHLVSTRLCTGWYCVAGDLFALSPETVSKLNLDSEDEVHAQMTRINHRVFRRLRWRERDTGRKKGCLEVLQTVLDLGKA